VVGRALLALALAVAFVAPIVAPTRVMAQDAKKPVVVDRVAVRWYAPELGGGANAQFVLERQLAFEARIEALAAGGSAESKPGDRQWKSALDRIVAETLLAQLPVRPPPTPQEVAKRAEAARLLLEDRVGGRERLAAAARTEGIVWDELDAFLRRTARASLYLDRMVAPMLDPNESEVKEAHASGRTPMSSRPYGEVAEQVRRWLVARRVEDALDAFYQRARSRITIVTAANKAQPAPKKP
jgi:hypothetical protein